MENRFPIDAGSKFEYNKCIKNIHTSTFSCTSLLARLHSGEVFVGGVVAGVLGAISGDVALLRLVRCSVSEPSSNVSKSFKDGELIVQNRRAVRWGEKVGNDRVYGVSQKLVALDPALNFNITCK